MLLTALWVALYLTVTDQHPQQHNGIMIFDIFFSEPSIIFGDTASIQYIHGKIIVPKNWSLEKVKQLKVKLENGN